MAIRFDDRVAIVTGAGNGLGRSHALMLAARGATVIVNDLGASVAGRGSSSTDADEVVKTIVEKGGKAKASYCSVTDPGGVEEMVQNTLREFGRVDVLINNAGFLRDKSFVKMTLDDFRAVLDVHLMGAVICTKAVWPAMIEQKYGRIVMTSSAAGIYGNFGQSNYGAAKMGMVGLTNVLKLEGERHGVLVNAVAPVAATRMNESILSPDALKKLRPEYVTAAAVFLASEVCTLNGNILGAGAGHFSMVRTVESVGTYWDAELEATPDLVLEQVSEINDFTDALSFANAMECIENALVPAGA